MNENYKGFTIYSANKDGSGTFYYIDAWTIADKYKSIGAAKGAITKHLNKQSALPDIVVVPRTQQEIDDYGPNGIQPPKSTLADAQKMRMVIVEVDVKAIRGKIKHPNATVHPIKSRNKREGGYCGRYKASNKNFKMTHYRVGPNCDFDTLKSFSKYKKHYGL